MSLRESFSKSIDLTVVKKYDKGDVMQISTLFVPFTMLLVQQCSERGLLKYLSNHDLGVLISEIQNLWWSSFLKKYSRFNLHFKYAKKNPEKVFCFWENFIWVTTINFSLLRKGYLSLEANMLAKSPKIWRITTRDFFYFNWFDCDQLIW